MGAPASLLDSKAFHPLMAGGVCLSRGGRNEVAHGGSAMKDLKTHAAEELVPHGASPKARRMPKVSCKAAGRSAVLGLRDGPCDGTVSPRDSGDIASASGNPEGSTFKAERPFLYKTAPKWLRQGAFSFTEPASSYACGLL